MELERRRECGKRLFVPLMIFLLAAAGACRSPEKEAPPTPAPAAAASPTAGPSALTPEEAREIAKEAYIYAFPMIENYKTMYAYSIDKYDPEYKAPFNEIFNTARVYTPEDKVVVTPNSDTPYSFVWLDLRAGPVVLSVPEIGKDRYYSIQLVDLYTYNFAYIGSRTTGNGAGSYLVAGPEWYGETPSGIAEVFRSDTEFVLALYRTQLFDPADIENVKKIQSEYKVESLSAFLGDAAPTPGPTPAPGINFPTYNAAEAHGIDFINYLNFLLRFCPTVPSEKELMERFAKIGIGPGEAFHYSQYPPDIVAAMEAGIADAKAAIDHQAATSTSSEDAFGTRAFLGDNYLVRAVAAKMGIYGNSKEEAVYVVYTKDSEGNPLDAAGHNYTLTFPKDGLPPANAFWSVTMYDAKTQLLVANPIDRYLINSPMLTGLEFADDGSLTIYIQSESPGAKKDSNWLPAPSGPFYTVLRIYWPKESVLDHSWTAPQPVAGP